MAISAKCPTYYTKVSFGHKPCLYQQVVCPSCNTVLEILRINPPVLDWVFESDNDYNDRGDYLFYEISFKKRR